MAILEREPRAGISAQRNGSGELPAARSVCRGDSRLTQLRDILYLGRSVYTPAGLLRFLVTPLPIFGQRSAVDLLAHGDVAAVRGALASDDEGLGF